MKTIILIIKFIIVITVGIITALIASIIKIISNKTYNNIKIGLWKPFDYISEKLKAKIK